MWNIEGIYPSLLTLTPWGWVLLPTNYLNIGLWGLTLKSQSVTNFSNSVSKKLTYSFAMKQHQVEKSFQNSCFVHRLCPFFLWTPFLRLSLISLTPNLPLPLAFSCGVLRAFSGSSVDKESACSAGDSSSIPGLGRSSGEGNGNLLQYSCLGNLMDKGVWQTEVHGGASQTQLSD